jgi:hypothetical protein
VYSSFGYFSFPFHILTQEEEEEEEEEYLFLMKHFDKLYKFGRFPARASRFYTTNRQKDVDGLLSSFSLLW